MLEGLNTAAAVGTFLVIGATAIAALVQLRHMRVNNQIEGLLSVLARVEDEHFNTWVSQAQEDVPKLIADPDYVKSVIDNTFDRDTAWLQMGNSYDWVGLMVLNRLIPEESMLGVYSFRIIQAWEILAPIIPVARYGVGDCVWENFEYLYIRAKEWSKKHPQGTFPKSLRRVELPPLPACVTRGDGQLTEPSLTGNAR